MAFKLNIVSGTTYAGKTGEQVTLDLTGPAGAEVEINHIRYAGTQVDTDPPFQFTIKKGSQGLVVLAEASKPGVQLKLVEVEGKNKQVLHEFFYDPQNPARGYTIKGESK